MVLPCFAGQGGGGPFALRQGEIRGETVPADRLALATLYVARMSDLMLTRLGVTAGDLVVEGSLAANPAYAALLAAFRPSQPVFAVTPPGPRGAPRSWRNGCRETFNRRR
jgi:hypothetical protein